MPRFVVLFHELPVAAMRASHWDMMLEDAGHLLTWELTGSPANAADWSECRRLADHRLAYLHYEGAVSNNRGHVTRWDEGNFEWEARSDLAIRVRLTGKKLQGTMWLTQESSCWYYRIVESA